jgi:hypothetical protein
MNLVGTLNVFGDIGDTADLTRFGPDGLAFRTDSKLILVQSSMVPEPSMVTLLAAAGLGLAGWTWRSRKRLGL